MYTDGIKINLTEEEIKNAIDWGAKNKDSPWKFTKPYAFHWHWYYGDKGAITTKISALADRGCSSARRYKSPERTEIDEILKSDSFPIIVFFIRGSRFALPEDYHMVLKQGEKFIHSIKTEAKRLIVPLPTFLGSYDFKWAVGARFLYSEIDPKAKTTIILVKPKSESRFEVDFSRYK